MIQNIYLYPLLPPRDFGAGGLKTGGFLAGGLTTGGFLADGFVAVVLAGVCPVVFGLEGGFVASGVVIASRILDFEPSAGTETADVTSNKKIKKEFY